MRFWDFPLSIYSHYQLVIWDSNVLKKTTKTCAIERTRVAVEFQKNLIQKYLLAKKLEHFEIFEKGTFFWQKSSFWRDSSPQPHEANQMLRPGLAMSGDVWRGRSGEVRQGPARLKKKSFSETYFLNLYHKKIRYSAHFVLAETFSIVKLMNSGYLFKSTPWVCENPVLFMT